MGFLLLIIIVFNQTLTGREMIVTPDFGLSDVLYVGYSSKVTLANSLRSFSLPLWNRYIGSGFPQIGFPIGTYNPINILLFMLLPAPQAYSLGLALSLLIASCGMYLFMRGKKMTREGSFLSGITFSLSAVFTARLVHFPVIQTMCFFPYLLWCADKIVYAESVQSRSDAGHVKSFNRFFDVVQYRLKFIVVGSFIVGIQILTGFYQIVLYSLIVSGLYVLWVLRGLQTGWKSKRDIVFALLVSVVLGFGLGSAQILPSLEFTRESIRSSGVGEQVFRFPYPPQHLLTFIYPYLLGDPRNGTYPMYSDSWGIFWENAGYAGIIPLLLAGLAIALTLKNRGANVIHVILLIFCLLLMFGKFGPLRYLYYIPPLSLFRVPARWMFFVVFFLAFFAGTGFDILRKAIRNSSVRRFAGAMLLLITALDLVWFATTYHLRGETRVWLKPPSTAEFLSSRPPGRIYSYGTSGFWNAVFLKHGWYGDRGNQYAMFLEGLEPNWNVLFDIPQAGSYKVLLTNRDAAFNTILNDVDLEKGTISPAARSALNMSSVQYIISPFILRDKTLIESYKSTTDVPFYVYTNTSSLPRARTVHATRQYRTTGEFTHILSSDTFDADTTALVEQELSFSGDGPSSVSIIKESDTEVILEATMKGEGMVILADTFYPGWHAKVDGNSRTIYPVNIKQRGVIVPDGTHTITFRYFSGYVIAGIIISIVSISALFAIALFTLVRYTKR